MTSQGLAGFRINREDKLAYNGSGSNPDMLGLRILGELRAVDDWDAVRVVAADSMERDGHPCQPYSGRPGWMAMRTDSPHVS